MPKVLISDKLSPAAVAIFGQRGIEADLRPGLSPDELKAALAGYDGLAIRSATKVTADIVAAADGLRVVGRAGIGVDNVDIPAATAKGIVVMNTPFGNAITTAEHTIALMLSLARQIPQADASTQAGKWEKSRFMGVELTGKTLGVIGCGTIGAIVADRARGLKMKVIGYDPFMSQERAVDLGVEKVELDDLLGRADVITLHVPNTEATRHMIDAAAIAKMKPGVRIINCARGGLVVEEDVRAALDSGHVAGAAFDVFAVEPAKESPLFGHPAVVCTPHLGASTAEAQENVALQIAEQMSDYLLTGAVSNALNMPSVTAEEAPTLRPYLHLAEQLGSFAGQITESAIKSASFEFQGEVAALNCRPITAIALTGVLTPLLASVNMVSAPIVARERGIAVSETKREQCDAYHTLIRVTLETERRTRSVAGTLFDGERPRIVEIESVPLEAEVTNHMLFVRNQDRPGLIGGLGTVLGNADVNIASFHLGRRIAGEDAVALVAVDEALPDDLLHKVSELPNVLLAKALRF